MGGAAGTTERDGTRIAWRREGAGEPLLMINGYGGSSADWDPSFISALAESSELLLLDNRGIGDSELGSAEVTIELMAADAAAVLDGLGIERCAVLGWSMGGYIAQGLAASAPENVSELILLSTDPGGAAAIPADDTRWSTLLDHSGSGRERADRLLGLLFPEEFAAGLGEDVRELVAEAQEGLSLEALEAQARAMELWHGDRKAAETRLAAIERPVLCAAGREDRVIPSQNVVVLADRLPGSWLARFPGAGHAFMAQVPERLARLIEVFLDR